MDGLVGHLHMQRVPVGVGIDGDGLDAHAPRGLDDPAGDLAPVGDQDLVEHALDQARERGSLGLSTACAAAASTHPMGEDAAITSRLDLCLRSAVEAGGDRAGGKLHDAVFDQRDGKQTLVYMLGLADHRHKQRTEMNGGRHAGAVRAGRSATRRHPRGSCPVGRRSQTRCDGQRFHEEVAPGFANDRHHPVDADQFASLDFG